MLAWRCRAADSRSSRTIPSQAQHITEPPDLCARDLLVFQEVRVQRRESVPADLVREGLESIADAGPTVDDRGERLSQQPSIALDEALLLEPLQRGRAVACGGWQCRTARAVGMRTWMAPWMHHADGSGASGRSMVDGSSASSRISSLARTNPK